MREKLYGFLVNRHVEIHDAYHRFHDDATGFHIPLSWLYLLWLNLKMYTFGSRAFGRGSEAAFEEKQPPLSESESSLAAKLLPAPEELAKRLAVYDVISFDIFDTLLFRPFSQPGDLFHFVGEQLGFLNFKQLRMRFEQERRNECRKLEGHAEISLAEIWEKMMRETGICAEEGIKAELAAEEEFCYANPYMLRVFLKLKEMGKCMIAVSDMYLPGEFLKRLLEKNGFEEFDRVYVSGEVKKSKAAGDLYELVKGDFPAEKKMIHIGDHPVSDVAQAKKHGFAAFYYPNADKCAAKYRTQDMSPIVGGAYRGVANHYLYCGLKSRSMEYEYGFLYGGLFVLGYCDFIHTYVMEHHIDRALFLSRDGDILKQAYDMLYPGSASQYVYWSRAAAAKLTAGTNKYDYFRRFLWHKVNQGRTIGEILAAMDLQELSGGLPEGAGLSEKLSDKNASILKRYLEERWELVTAVYETQRKAAERYYSEILDGCRNVCAVDIGWAGSGAMALSGLVEKEWKLSCRVVGIIAGTNTPHTEEPEANEIFLTTGKLVPYLYSSSLNRDLWQWHDPNRNDNLYWELLLSSDTRQFLGFDLERGEVKLCFGKAERNQEGIREIQRGILDFAREYKSHFANRPQMLHISGRDAYAPLLAASGGSRRYPEAIYEKFGLAVQVGE